jgi:hypothetical protein
VLRKRWPVLALVLGFAATTALWERAGVRFRSYPIDSFAQLLDPPLLRDRLLESLWHLHAQPPLFNLLVGLALKVSPDDPGGPLRAAFLLSGLAACLATFVALRALAYPRALAAVLALAFASTPTFAIYEHWGFYPHLELTLVAIAAAAFLRAGGGSPRALAGGFGALGALALLRSIYHPAYVAAAAMAATALAAPGARRRTLAAAAPAVAVVLLLATKNLFLFGFFGTSSWGGNSLHRVMTESLDPAVVEEMVRGGELHRISLVWEFSTPLVYVPMLAPGAPDTGIPALDQTGKTRTRQNAINYNHWVYPMASREYLRGALRMMRAHPEAYVRSVRWTARRFLDPVTADPFVKAIRTPVRELAAPFDAAERSPVLLGLVAAAVAWALARLVRGRGRREERLFLAFALGTLLWGSAASILLEYGENNRFRWHLTPLVFLLAAMAVRDAVRRGRPGPRIETSGSGL